MLSIRAGALACAGALAACAAASGATPSVMLAQSLKRSMQAFYDKAEPGLELTRVSCVLASNGRSGHCVAHYTLASRHLLGVFQLAETIDPASGEVHTKTLSAKCTSSRTGKAVSS